jgi:multiple sugar transport system substrate-binding protein
MKKFKLLTSVVLVLAVVMISSITSLAAVPEPAFPATMPGNISLTFWSWGPDNPQLIAEFEKVYPNIKVDAPLVGTATATYEKLQTVTQAGSGAPDVVTVDYTNVPQYVNMGALLDITQYVKDYESFYFPFAWSACKVDGKVYGTPFSIGSLAMYYQTDRFAKAGITELPKTWDDYAADAAKFKVAYPNDYFSYFPIDAGTAFIALAEQAGVHPFQFINGKWNINLNNAAEKKVMDYWADLMNKGYVKAINSWTPEWTSGIGSGKFANLFSAPWTDGAIISPLETPAANQWNIANMPQWDTSKVMNSNFGGSAICVDTQSKNPAAAALFSAYCTSSAASTDLALTPYPAGGGAVPANNACLVNPLYLAPDSVLNGQDTAPIWKIATSTTDQTQEWSPFSTFIFQNMSSEFQKASQGQETWDKALDNSQAATMSYANSLGYMVTEGVVNANDTSSSSSSGVNMWLAVGIPIAVVVIILLIVLIMINKRKSSKKAQ